MNQRIAYVLLMSLLFTIPCFAAVGTDEEESIPHYLRNNEFYIESLRLNELAQETFDYGDYDASAGLAEEAVRYVQLSNEYIAFQLIIEAKRYIEWADSNSIRNAFPDQYNEGIINYEVGVIAHANEEWNESISALIASIEIFSALESSYDGPHLPAREPEPSVTTAAYTPAQQQAPEKTPLPGQYTVRPWAVSKDCYWNIAGYSWVYGDSRKWRVLYEANKSKMPDPNNPDLILVGMVMDIPSIDGETRQGMWDQNKTYER
ncbi:MAG: LysM peptidoglycan-binding domain-containing protein [Treponema sp.]|nr:LysM peptidoglycan-binding domain-containing protein [Treponema sp.]